ncbi:MAG: co-chaperone GroES [Patescibacteria group bacterium]
MTLVPVGNRVVVQLKEKETTTASGIIVSSNTGEKEQQYGVIIALGTGKSSEGETPAELGLAVGDTVLFSKYGGEEVKDDAQGIVYKVLKASDIVAVVK